MKSHPVKNAGRATDSYPTPFAAAHKDAVYVGRIRNDSSNPNGIAMWITSDNTLSTRSRSPKK